MQYLCEVGKDHFPFLQLENQDIWKRNYLTEECSEKCVVPEEIFPAHMAPSRGLVLGMWLSGHLNGINSNESTHISTFFFLCELSKLTLYYVPKNKRMKF